MAETLTTDILIIGAGPVGLYGAYCAGFRELSTVVVDALPQCGGQIAALYPEKEIGDIAAVPGALGREVVDALKEQADSFHPTYLLGRQAVELSRSVDGRPRVVLSDGVVIDAGAVIITAGIGAFRPRSLPVGEQFLGRGLTYFVPDPAAHADRDVLVVGGGDSAIDWALALQPIASSVTLVHRRNSFRAHAASVTALRDGGVDIVTGAQVESLFGDEWISEAHIKVDGEDETRVLKVTDVVAALGFISNLGPLEQWGIELQSRNIAVDTRMQTNLERVYAAGDIATYLGKIRLMSVGFGEVATAVNNAATVLYPELSLFPGHSTDASFADASSLNQ